MVFDQEWCRLYKPFLYSAYCNYRNFLMKSLIVALKLFLKCLFEC